MSAATSAGALPALSASEAEHESVVRAHIAQQVQQAGGWLDFAQFLNLALYAPGLGYYSAGAHKFGAGGDFTTAPEVSSLFSRAWALQVADVLRATKGDVLELGAGSGVMAADMLLELARQQVLPQRYCILELSADLRERQYRHIQTHAPQYLDRVTWLDRLPEGFVGCVIANEVVDALPVSRFVIEQGLPRALGVAMQDDQFVWQSREASAALVDAVRGIERDIGHALPDGFVSEVNLQLGEWLAGTATALHRGVMMFIDYGHSRAQYYNHERAQGTLACFHRHRLHDNPFVNLGLQDITAWVDFTALAEAGLAAGLQLQGFATQAHFLFGCGLQTLLQDMNELPDAERWQISQQVQKLTLPGEMGEVFKAMAFTKDCELELRGFSFRDLRDRL